MKKPIIQDKSNKQHRPIADSGVKEVYDPQFIGVSGNIKMVEDGLYLSWCDCPNCAIRVFASYSYPLLHRDAFQAHRVAVVSATVTVTTVVKQLSDQPDAYQAGQVKPTGGRVQRLLTDYQHPDPDAYSGHAVIPAGGHINSLLTHYSHSDPEAYQGGSVIPTGGRLWADLVRYTHPAEDAYQANHVQVTQINIRST